MPRRKGAPTRHPAPRPLPLVTLAALAGLVLALAGHLLRMRQARMVGALLFFWGVLFACVVQAAGRRQPDRQLALDAIAVLTALACAVGSYFVMR